MRECSRTQPSGTRHLQGPAWVSLSSVSASPPPHFHSSGLVEECPDRPALAVPFVLWQPCFHLLPTFL